MIWTSTKYSSGQVTDLLWITYTKIIFWLCLFFYRTNGTLKPFNAIHALTIASDSRTDKLLYLIYALVWFVPLSRVLESVCTTDNRTRSRSANALKECPDYLRGTERHSRRAREHFPISEQASMGRRSLEKHVSSL